MENELLVSVVIPVYNAEKTLRKCVESVLNQTYPCLEICLVNDGSTDESIKICNQYALEYKQIKVIDQINSGVSAARNTGIMNTKGRYICFLDSDDTYEKTYISKLYGLMKKTSHIGMAICQYRENDIDKVYQAAPEGEYSLHDYTDIMLQNPTDFFFGVLWNKMFVRDIIEKHNISFQKGLNMGEDFIFVTQYMKYIKKIGIVSDVLYNYNTDCSLLTKKIYSSLEKWNMRKIMYLSYWELFKAESDNSVRKSNATLYIINNAKYLSRELLDDNRIQDAKIILDDEVLNTALKYYTNDKRLSYNSLFCYFTKNKYYIGVYLFEKIRYAVANLRNRLCKR